MREHLVLDGIRPLLGTSADARSSSPARTRPWISVASGVTSSMPTTHSSTYRAAAPASPSRRERYDSGSSRRSRCTRAGACLNCRFHAVWLSYSPET